MSNRPQRIGDVTLPYKWRVGRVIWFLRRVPGEDIEQLATPNFCLELLGDLTQRPERVAFVSRLSRAEIVSYWDEDAVAIFTDALGSVGISLEFNSESVPL